MTERTPPFEIVETRIDGCLRLSLRGELDRWSAHILDDRLARLRAVKSAVRLDLSELEFIDSSGLHFLLRTVGQARLARWPLQIEHAVTPQVRSVFRLVHLESYLLGFQAVPDTLVKV